MMYVAISDLARGASRPRSEELPEIKSLKNAVRDLKESNEILCQASIFLRGNSTLATVNLSIH